MNITCPTCNKVYNVPDRNIPEGKKVTTKCKNCGGRIVVEAGVDTAGPAAPKTKFAADREAETGVKESVPVKKERFKVKESVLFFLKIIPPGIIIASVIIFLFRHSVPGGIEAAVAFAIIFPILGILIYLFIIQFDKYFIEISDEEINLNNEEHIIWRDIKEVKTKNYIYMGFIKIGQSIVISHFDKNRIKRSSLMFSYLTEQEKLYKAIMDNIKPYPDTGMEIEGGWSLSHLPAYQIRAYIYCLALFAGLVIYIYTSSPQTESKSEFINKKSPANSQSTNKSVPKSQFHKHLVAGYNFYEQGDYSNAVAEYNKAMEDDPNNNEGYYYRGATYLKTGEIEKALPDFKRSIELNPRHFKSYQNLNWLLAKERKWDDIINYLDEYIQLEPGHAQAYLERGHAYYLQGNRDSALKDVKKSCDLGNSEGCTRYKQLKQKSGK
jgi:tetratricopeptide (TPR) repeat protein